MNELATTWKLNSAKEPNGAAGIANGIPNGILAEEQELYQENILDHYKHPRNKRALAAPALCQREVNPLCGDEVVVYVHASNGVVAEAAFTGSGCAISQASASLLTEFLQGKRLEEVRMIREQDIFSLLRIPISMGRVKCALLPLKALKGGIGTNFP